MMMVMMMMIERKFEKWEEMFFSPSPK